MSSLQTLSANMLNEREAEVISDFGMDELMFAHLDPNIQLKLTGYSFITSGRKIISYSSIRNSRVDLVTYNNDDFNQSEEYRDSYPADDKWLKYCGSLSTVILLYPTIGMGTYCEYRIRNLYRAVDLKTASNSEEDSDWVLEGSFTQLFPDGETEISGKFTNNRVHNFWTRYYPKNEQGKCQMMLKYFFQDGNQTVLQKGLFPNGDREFTAHYSNKKLNGWFKRHTNHEEYDLYEILFDDGSIQEVHWYSVGQEVYPLDASVDITLPRIYDPIDISFSY